jgi:hypothetical protein
VDSLRARTAKISTQRHREKLRGHGEIETRSD